MRALTEVKNWSNKYGTDEYITSLTLDKNGNNVYNGNAPSMGEIWVFKSHDLSGVTNGVWPVSGGKVTSSAIFINTSSAAPIDCYLETWDALVQDNQNSWGATMNPWPQWWCFMLNRPRDSNDYEVTTTYESQTGIDSFTTWEVHAQTAIQRMPDGLSFNSFMGDREYIDVESIGMTRRTPLKPKQQEDEQKAMRQNENWK